MNRIMVGILTKSGQWLILPLDVYDDGFEGACWPVQANWPRLGLCCMFMKKTSNGRIL